MNAGTVIIGAGQAGLALSRELSAAGHEHVLLERGRIGERWRSERWRSLRLLTPNWLNRLPGGPGHADPHGYLDRDGFVRYLEDYADEFDAPVEEGVSVLSVEARPGGFVIGTDRGERAAARVVVATGDCETPRFPSTATGAPGWLDQLHASAYVEPERLREGGVLVVGAGPSGQQIALELRRAGREVSLAAGGHVRMPRRYRGRDIWNWLCETGVFTDSVDDLDERFSARTPNMALSTEPIDLGRLHEAGVRVTGRLLGFAGGRAVFADDLDGTLAAAERRMRRVLARVDAHIARHGLAAPRDEHPRPVALAASACELDLRAAGITTVIYATGYRRVYPWLHVPGATEGGELVHRHGITRVPGLYALGLRFQRRRGSHLIGGVGEDAAFIAARLAGRSSPRATPSPSAALAA